MSFVAVAIGGSALVGAGASIISGNKSAGAIKDGAAQNAALTREQMADDRARYEQGRADLAPYREAGYTALNQIGAGTAAGGEFNRNFTMADYTADPGYQFRLDQGNRGVEASAAARGGVLSGGTLKAIARYNSDTASQEYGAAYSRFNNDTTTRFNRLASIAGVGQTATNTGIAAGQSASAQAGALNGQLIDSNSAAANARASSYINTGQAIGQTANSIGQYFALKDMYKVPNVGAAGAYGVSGSGGIY